MLNFGWAELMVIGVVALIVIGPEDLPDMFRQLGRFTAKLRSMSREFSRAMDQAAKDSGVKDVARDLKGITSPKAMGLDAVKSAADRFEKWDPVKNAAKPATASSAKPLVPPPMPATSLPAAFAPTARMPDPVMQDLQDDLAEANEDLAEHSLSRTAEPAHGPATQALYDKQAARAAVIAEQTAKLKAIEDGTYRPVNTILAPKLPQSAVPDSALPETALPETALPETALPKKRATRSKTATAETAARTPRRTSKKADTA